MAPWVIAGLLSPWLALAILVIVAVATTILYVAAKGVVSQLGVGRIAMGYFGAITLVFVLTLLGHLVLSFARGEFFAVLAFFSYAACAALAVIIVPLFCALAARGYASAFWTIGVSALTGVAVAAIAYGLQRSGVREERELRLLFDMLYAAPFLVIVGVGFSLGARLPWTKRKGSMGSE